MSDAKGIVTVKELIQLTKLGIPLQNVTWSRVSMTSDTHICIRYDQQDGPSRNSVKGQLMMISLKDGFTHKKWSMSPESAKISPSSSANSNHPFVAIKTGDTIMVLHLDRNSWDVVAKCYVEKVVYWTWIHECTLALVTEHDVRHWNVTKNVIPEKVFSLHQRLMYAEIINYKTDSACNWLAVTGLLAQEYNISGITQLYSAESGLTQCITAHTVTFFTYTFEGNRFPSTVLAVAARHEETYDCNSNTQGKVHVIELGPHQEGNLAPVNVCDQIKFQDGENKYDFPVAIQVSSIFGLLYVLTKYGQMYICDIENATCLISTSIASKILFTSVLDTSSQGIVGVCRSGKVLHIGVNLEELALHVRHVSRKPVLAQKIEETASRWRSGTAATLSSTTSSSS